MYDSTSTSNVIDFPGRDASTEIPERDDFDYAPDAGVQLWSALTLGSLQKQLTGHEDDPRFSAARALVDNLAKQFATANPIDIADYFLAIETLDSLKGNSRARLDELDDSEYIAA